MNRHGRAAEGIAVVDMAMRLSPQDPMLWAMQCVRAVGCFHLENNDEAEVWARKAVHARPDLWVVQFVLALALAGQDRLDDARVAIATARRLEPNLLRSVTEHALQHYHPEYIERIFDLLAKLGLHQ